jgi:hypothetical protein
MFDKIGRLAEKAADSISVSRRGFLGRLGQGAMALGALLAGSSAAAGKNGGTVCCVYSCANKYLHYNTRKKCQPAGTTCTELNNGCGLWRVYTMTDCTKCR